MSDDPFISRTFELEHPDGTREPLTLRIEKPEPALDDELGGFRCTYFIKHFMNEPRSVWGSDSLGALTMALAHAQGWLWAKNEGPRGTLRWQDTTELAIFPLRLDEDGPIGESPV